MIVFSSIIPMETETRLQSHSIQHLHSQNIKWAIYATRAFFILFIVSCSIEVLRISADDRAVYLHALDNPPEGCVTLVLQNEWSWSMLHRPISVPMTWLYKTFFEAPIKSDCVEFYRRTNPMLLYLPKFPQAMANVGANFFLAPFIIFLDKFGDALRHFMDKFNVAERIFGVILLIATMLLSTVMFVFMLSSSRSLFLSPQIQHLPPTRPIRLLKSPRTERQL